MDRQEETRLSIREGVEVGVHPEPLKENTGLLRSYSSSGARLPKAMDVWLDLQATENHTRFLSREVTGGRAAVTLSRAQDAEGAVRELG